MHQLYFLVLLVIVQWQLNVIQIQIFKSKFKFYIKSVQAESMSSPKLSSEQSKWDPGKTLSTVSNTWKSKSTQPSPKSVRGQVQSLRKSKNKVKWGQIWVKAEVNFLLNTCKPNADTQQQHVVKHPAQMESHPNAGF